MHHLCCLKSIFFILLTSVSFSVASYGDDENDAPQNAPQAQQSLQQWTEDSEQDSNFIRQEFEGASVTTLGNLDLDHPDSVHIAREFLQEIVDEAKREGNGVNPTIEIVVGDTVDHNTSAELLGLAAETANQHDGQILEAPMLSEQHIANLASTAHFKDRMNFIDKQARKLAKTKTDAIAAIRGRGLGGTVFLSLLLLKDYSVVTAAALGSLCHGMSRRLGQENSFIMRWLPTLDVPPAKSVQMILAKAGYKQAAEVVERFRSKTAPKIWQFVKISGLVFGYLSMAHFLKYAMGIADMPMTYEQSYEFINALFWPTLWGTIAETGWMSFNSMIYNEKLKDITLDLYNQGNTDEALELAIQKMADEIVYNDRKAASVSIGSTSAQMTGYNATLVVMGALGLGASYLHRKGFGLDIRKVWSSASGLVPGRWFKSSDGKRGWLSTALKTVFAPVTMTAKAAGYVVSKAEGLADLACKHVFGEIPTVK